MTGAILTSPTFASLARDLHDGKTTSEALTEACLAAIYAPNGEGQKTFVHVDTDGARAQARAMDTLRAAGASVSPYAGIPISVKDLFDVAGQVTSAGSVVLAGEKPAGRDAEAVSRLRRAGLVIVGRTNMSEFAFSGVGINPHYGTPAISWDRASRRIPGGSSSGAAISVSDGMAHGAIGTDTGGSCRIPAAFTGLVGYKPTARLVPSEGTVPLSPSLDSVGPIGRSVDCCVTLTSILSGMNNLAKGKVDLAGLRLVVPTNFVTDGMDATVSLVFDASLERLSRAGVIVRRLEMPVLDSIPSINALGGFAAAESYHWHRKLLERDGGRYDPRVRVRMERGRSQTAADYLDLLNARAGFIAAVEELVDGYDAIVMPTVPIVPPRIDNLMEDSEFARINLLLLRNPAVINLLDGCAISLPIHAVGEAPVGLMLAAPQGHDSALLRLARGVETLFAQR